MRVIYYSGRTQNTHHFVQGLNLEAGSVQRIQEDGTLDGPLPVAPVLILPTYADHTGHGAIPDPVKAFLRANPAYRISGLMAGGNKNFGSTYALAGRLLSARMRIPVLHDFELRGMPKDYAAARKQLEQHFA